LDRGIKNEPFSFVHVLYDKTKMILFEILLALILAYLSIMVIGVITYGMVKKILIINEKLLRLMWSGTK